MNPHSKWIATRLCMVLLVLYRVNFNSYLCIEVPNVGFSRLLPQGLTIWQVGRGLCLSVGLGLLSFYCLLCMSAGCRLVGQSEQVCLCCALAGMCSLVQFNALSVVCKIWQNVMSAYVQRMFLIW